MDYECGDQHGAPNDAGRIGRRFSRMLAIAADFYLCLSLPRAGEDFLEAGGAVCKDFSDITFHD